MILTIRNLRLFCWLLVLIGLFAMPASALPPAGNISPAVSSATVQDTEGKPYRLGDSWQNKPVVLVFIRHFG